MYAYVHVSVYVYVCIFICICACVIWFSDGEYQVAIRIFRCKLAGVTNIIITSHGAAISIISMIIIIFIIIIIGSRHKPVS